MYNNKSILAFIPARIGSKRIKEKNIQLLNGKPLFLYSVDIAKNSKYIDNILVSTDSSEIKDLSIKNGCLNTGLRPAELSGDRARIVDAILYEIKVNNINPDVIVLLQPTFPFRTVEILDGAIEKYFHTGEESLITISKTIENPVFFRSLKEDDSLDKLLDTSSDIRSQDFQTFYKIVGNIYINNFHNLTHDTILNENKYGYLISEDYCLDIDTYEDLNKARNKIEGNIKCQ